MNSLRYTPELALPWESTSEEDRLYRQVQGATLAMLLVLSITLPLLPLQEIIAKVQAEPPTLMRVKLEKKVLEKEVLPKPKPTPVAVKSRPKKEIVEAEPKPAPKPKRQSTPEESWIGRETKRPPLVCWPSRMICRRCETQWTWIR